MSTPPKPVGPVIAPASYTQCVPKGSFVPEPKLDGADPASTLIKFCAYELGGKLVCLPPPNGPGVRCAIGRVIEIEEVGYGKVGIEQIDDDWCINLLLAPNELRDFAPEPGPPRTALTPDQAMDVARGKVQSYLIDLQKPVPPAAVDAWGNPRVTADDLPAPADALGDPPVTQASYFFDALDQPVLFHFDTGEGTLGDVGPNLLANLAKLVGGWFGADWNPKDAAKDQAQAALTQAFGVGPTKIPVLHCEVEGSRVSDFCSVAVPLAEAAEAFNQAAAAADSACKGALSFLPFGIGDVVCDVLTKIATVIGSWIGAIAAGLAGLGTWALARPGSTDVAGLVRVGDPVILSGRWAFDAAHSGWNELHPVLTLQKLADDDWTQIGDLADFAATWCQLVQEAPPPDAGLLGLVSSGLTTAQQPVYSRQQTPEQGWVVHPAIDGCTGSVDLTFSPPPAAPPPPVGPR